MHDEEGWPQPGQIKPGKSGHPRFPGIYAYEAPMDDSLEGLVSKVEAMNLEHDDALVLTCSRVLSDEQRAHLQHYLYEQMGAVPLVVLDEGMQLSLLGQHRQLQRIEQSLAGVATALQAVLKLLSDGEEPAEARTLDGDLFSTRERDQSQPL